MKHKAFYQDVAKDFLMQQWQKKNETEMGMAWVEATLREEGRQVAQALRDQLQFTDLSLRHELRLLSIGDEKTNLAEQAKTWRLSSKMYTCKQCGVQVHAMRWHCPKCNKWGTMEPIQTSQPFGEQEHA